MIQCTLCWVIHQSHVQLVTLGREIVAPACGVSIKLAQEQAVLYLHGYMSNWLWPLLFEQGWTPIGFIFCCLSSKQNSTGFLKGWACAFAHLCTTWQTWSLLHFTLCAWKFSMITLFKTKNLYPLWSWNVLDLMWSIVVTELYQNALSLSGNIGVKKCHLLCSYDGNSATRFPV